MADLNGKTIAFLVAAEGTERVELTEPWAAVVEAGVTPVLLSPQEGQVQTFDHLDKAETLPVDKAVKDAGASVELISLEDGEVQAFNHLDHADKIKVDKAVANADESDYDGLVLPGGVANPDFLRGNEDAVDFVRSFVKAAKPVGVICHGPWTLVEADVLRGRTITSWPSLQTDIRNAGGNWVDEEVVVDEGLVSSRKPDDLPAFCAKIVEEFCEGEHEAQARSVGAARA